MEELWSFIAIVISITSFIGTCYTFWWTARRDCRQATLEAYNRLQSEVFDAINLYSPSEIKEICYDTRSEEYKTLSGYLARIEHFCVGVNSGVYDKSLFYALAHGYFDGYQLRKRIEPILESKNKSTNTRDLYYSNTYEVLEQMGKKVRRKVRR